MSLAIPMQFCFYNKYKKFQTVRKSDLMKAILTPVKYALKRSNFNPLPRPPAGRQGVTETWKPSVSQCLSDFTLSKLKTLIPFLYFGYQFKDGKEVMRLMQKKKIQPHYYGHFAIREMNTNTTQIIILHSIDLCNNFSSCCYEILYDLPRWPGTIIMKQRIRFGMIS